MFKQLSLLVLTVVLGLSTVVPQAHAVDLSEALKRMDAIIVEMNLLRAEFATLAEVTTPAPAVQGSVSGGVLGDDIAFGSTNDDIKRIQKLLATDSTIYPYGAATGFFGPKTRDAIRAFQARFDLDTVGVVGPSTRALLEVFFAAYPVENYPDDVLKKVAPKVAGAATSRSSTIIPTTTGTRKSISVTDDDDEYIVKSYKTDGTRNRDLILYPENGDELVEMIAKKLGVSESEVRKYVDEDDLDFESGSSKSNNADEDDADEAIKDADDEIDDARDKIKDAEADGDDVDDADELYTEARDLYKEARDARDDEDYDEAIEKAKEAEKTAKKAVDALDGGDSDDVDLIEVIVREDDARVEVEFGNGDDKRFTVEDTDREDIIEEIADELDIRESEVRDIIKFDYGDIERITTSVSDLNDVIRVRVYFETGSDVKFTFDEDTDEDDIIEEIAEMLDLRESEVEDEFELD